MMLKLMGSHRSSTSSQSA